MKNKFSPKWKASKQPRKQRKFRANAPLHIKRKFLSVNLSKELRKKYSRRNVVVRVGDKVKILSGKLKGKEGKVTKVFTKKGKVIIEGIQVKKQDGSKANLKFWASKLQIVELNTNDSKRIIAKKQNNIKEQQEKK